MSKGYGASGCWSKNGYASKEEAEYYAPKHMNLHVYRCLVCGQFHLSRKKKVRK